MEKKQSKYFEFLDELKESGLVNMFRTGSILEQNFPELNKDKAMKILVKWMKEFRRKK